MTNEIRFLDHQLPEELGDDASNLVHGRFQLGQTKLGSALELNQLARITESATREEEGDREEGDIEEGDIEEGDIEEGEEDEGDRGGRGGSKRKE